MQREDPEDEIPDPRGMSRRRVLGFIGTAAAATLIANCRADTIADEPMPQPFSDTPPQPQCIVRPQQTEGPYFVDERLNRSDIRSDPGDGSLVPGTLLQLTFRVSRMNEARCIPLEGAIVDVWQCDALGVYSDIRDFQGLFDTRGKKFLRGYQTTGADGRAGFLTIYPGWYVGRAVHIHFKIRMDPTSRRGHELTSQIYFDDALTDQVHAEPPYATKRGRRTRNAMDGIFRNGGSELMLPVTKSDGGYDGTFDIALRL